MGPLSYVTTNEKLREYVPDIIKFLKIKIYPKITTVGSYLAEI